MARNNSMLNQQARDHLRKHRDLLVWLNSAWHHGERQTACCLWSGEYSQMRYADRVSNCQKAAQVRRANKINPIN